MLGLTSTRFRTLGWVRVGCLGAALWWSGVPAVQASTEPVAFAKIQDDRGSWVVLASPPRRIVSLLPSLTETVCELGECDRIVATDRWSNWPERVRHLPKLGGLDDIQIERLVALRPDLVLLAPSSRLGVRLRALGLVVAELEARDLPEARRVMVSVAQLLGVPERADLRWRRLQQALDAEAAKVARAAKGQSVYFEVSSTPYAAGEASFIGQMLTQLGLRNVVGSSLGPFPKLNPEHVVRGNPSLILVSASEADALSRRPGWGRIQAVRHNAVCALSPAEVDVLARPGPRLAEGMKALVRCTHLLHRSERQP